MEDNICPMNNYKVAFEVMVWNIFLNIYVTYKVFLQQDFMPRKSKSLVFMLGTIQSIVTLRCGEFENDFMLWNFEDVIVGIWNGFQWLNKQLKFYI